MVVHSSARVPERADGRGDRWRTRRALGNVARLTALAVAALLVCPASTPSAAAGPTTCPTGSQVSVMAHPDDDLFFMNPDIIRAITSSGWCTTTVYVTSGDAGESSAYYLSREQGVRAAYAQMAGVANTWTSTTVLAAGHSVTQYALTAAPTIRLDFLHLPDGNIDGSGFASTGRRTLQRLYQGDIATITTADNSQQTYTRSALVSTLATLITTASPTIIRTQDYVHDFGADNDHSDHHAVGKLVLEARDASAPGVAITPYLGYPSADLPANVTGADLTAKDNAFLAYAPYDSKMCQSLAACASRPESTWLPRQYTATAASTPQPGPGTADGNAAASATVTASSQNTADGQTAAKVVDGIVDGYPGDHTAEWATVGGGAGSWVQLAWMEPISLGQVVLFDRPNTSDRITSGTLTFSDGSTVAVPALADDGSRVAVTFPATTTTSVRLTVTGVSASTRNIGLAEFQAWTSGATTTPTPTPTPTSTSTPGASNVATTASVVASSESVPTGQTAAKAVDDVIDGYPGDYTAEWATSGGGTGSYLQLTWASPVQLARVVLYDRPNTSDRVTSGTLTFADGSVVAVPALDDSGAATAVDFPATTTSSLRFTVAGVSATTTNVGLAELQAWTPGTGASPTATATATPTPTATPTSGLTNRALSATATASSAAVGQGAAKAVDGVVDGYPGDYTAEWATVGGRSGSTLTLTWASTVQLGRVVLFDRPNTADRVTGATITFSDGTTVTVGALDDAGGATTVSFTPRATSSMVVTVTSVSDTTVNAGLSEVQAYAA